MRALFNFLICYFSLLTASQCLADEDDLEFDFVIHQKSTIDNFPLKAIDQDTLSNTAIEGALQVQTRASQDNDSNGKPIYQKVKEEDQKKQTEEVISESEKDLVGAEDLLKFSQIIPNQPQFDPIIYQQPTGRTYTEHNTTTTSRP